MNKSEISLLVEKSIENFKIDVASTRQPDGRWKFILNDSTVWVEIFDTASNPGSYYIQVMSFLCGMPDKKADEFAVDLLEINWNLYGCAMSKSKSSIYVLSLREALGLDQTELDATIGRVSKYSSDYYSKLSFKYQGCWLPKQATTDKPPTAL